jgi:aminoglycoside 3-N-acetyltransferase I
MKKNKLEFQIKRLVEDDVKSFQELIALFNEVFETENKLAPGEAYLKKLLTKKEFIVLVATSENEIIGGLTGYEMPLYTEEHSELYIYDMAVKQSFQRMNAGKQLIAALGDYCKQNNIKTIMVEAHEEDKHAVTFYKSAGGKPEKVVHFNFEIL